MQYLKLSYVHAIGVAGLVTAAAASFLLGYLPAAYAEAELVDATHRTGQLVQRLDEVERANADLRRQISDWHRSQQEKYSLTTQAGQPVLETISRLLDQHQLNLDNFRDETSGHDAQQIMEIQLHGAYADFIRLCADLRRLDRPARLVSLYLSTVDPEGQTCNARFKLQIHPPLKLARWNPPMQGVDHE